MNSILNLFLLAAKQALRHRTRSLLTVLGVAVGMLLFSSVETMQSALAQATRSTAEDTTLVVYRENRFCPATSRLPEHYINRIRKIDGVAEAIPVQVAVNNCGASLDVIAFRGVPQDDLQRYNPDIELVDGSLEEWKRRSDAALVGEHFAARRNLEPGDTFEAVGVRVVVAGIIQSPNPQDNNVAYVHLPFLQQASRVGLGIVTQFNVRVTDSRKLQAVARAIDTVFESDSAPTITRPEKAFFAQTASDLVEMIGFTRWIGLGAVLGVFGLVANSLLLAARSRVREGAILQTLGYPQQAIGMLVVFEGLLLGLAGGILGCCAAAAFFALQRLSFGSEGQTLTLNPDYRITLAGIAVALLLAVVAALWPAWESARRPIVQSLRDS